MSRSSRGLIRSLLALAFVAALVPAAQAATTQTYQTPKRHHHVYTYTREVVRHPGEIYVNKAPRSYLDYGEPEHGPGLHVRPLFGGYGVSPVPPRSRNFPAAAHVSRPI